MLLMLDSSEELALEGFVRGNRSTESFGRVGKRVFAETSEGSVVGWGFPEVEGGFLGEDLSESAVEGEGFEEETAAEGSPEKEGFEEETVEEPSEGEETVEEPSEGEETVAEEPSEEETSSGYSSAPSGWEEVFSQSRNDSGDTFSVSGMEFEDVEEVEDEDKFENTEDEEEEFEDAEVEFEDVEEVKEDAEDEGDEFEDTEDGEEEFEDTEEDEEDTPTEVEEFTLDDTSSNEEAEEVEEDSVEEEPSGYSGGLEFEDVEEVDDADEDTEEEDVDDAEEASDPVEVVRAPKPREVALGEVSTPKRPTHKPRKRLPQQEYRHTASTSQEPYHTSSTSQGYSHTPSTPQESLDSSQEAKLKSQKRRPKKPSTNTHTSNTPKRSPGIRRLEPIPATVREYVMANPDVCYNDVVKLYSLKQIKKELALGRIYRSGNKLGV